MEGYVNVPEQILTLSQVSEKVTEYPAIVHVQSQVYEEVDAKELPADTDILLEEPKTLQFVLIRILDFDDELQKKNEKGEEFIKERKKYVGKEFLIPVGYKGTFKLINKTGRKARFVSVDQIIRELPRFIRIEQEIPYTPPGESHASTIINEGTTLEVKRVSSFQKLRYIKCKSVKTAKTYIFREDLPINCSAADDPDEHNFLNIAGKFILLPKNAQFQSVWADDVVIKDDEEASTMLMLTGGPVKILKVFIRRNMYIARTKNDWRGEQTVGLIPNNIWDKQLVKLMRFQSTSQKQSYILKHFGRNFDSTFIMSGLYKMNQIETEIVWLRPPLKKKEAEDELADYINFEKVLSDYENVYMENKAESDSEDYETPVKNAATSPAPPVPEAPPIPSHAPPVVPPRPPKIESLQLPTLKPKKDDIFQKIKEKAKMGFDKVHEQLLRRHKQKQIEEDERSKVKPKKVYSRSVSESGLKHEQKPSRKSVSSPQTKHFDSAVAQSLLTGDDSAIRDDKTIQRLSREYQVNKDRPLPLPPKSERNVTDDDKLAPYDDVQTKDEEFKKYLENVRKEQKSDPKLDTLAGYPDLWKISQSNQTIEDFYSYTVEELVECFKLCGLEKVAIQCSEGKLDGEFFRNFDIDDFQKDPFFLSKLDLFKVRKILKGWRPKTDNV